MAHCSPNRKKVIGVYAVNDDGMVTNEYYVSRLVSESTMRTLEKPSDGYNRTRCLEGLSTVEMQFELLDSAKKFTDTEAERALALMQSSGCAGSFRLVILDVDSEMERIRDAVKADSELEVVCNREFDRIYEYLGLDGPIADEEYTRCTNEARKDFFRKSCFVRGDGWIDVCAETVYL